MFVYSHLEEIEFIEFVARVANEMFHPHLAKQRNVSSYLK